MDLAPLFLFYKVSMYDFTHQQQRPMYFFKKKCIQIHTFG